MTTALSMEDRSAQIEHLKMVQAIIARMAGNSAQLKTWTVLLVTAIITFLGLSDDPEWPVAMGGCVPVFAFWLMDAQYLHLERRYRHLHEKIVSGEEIAPFDLNCKPYAHEVESIWRSALSWSVWPFYGLLLVMIVGISFFLCLSMRKP